MEQAIMEPQELDEIKDLVSCLLTSVEMLVLEESTKSSSSSTFLPQGQAPSPLHVSDGVGLIESVGDTDTTMVMVDKLQKEDADGPNGPAWQDCSPPKMEMVMESKMQDSWTAMSQELELYTPSREVKAEVKDAFTAMSQELEEIILAVERKDSTTSMSQEFLMLQTPVVDHRDAFTASTDLYATVEVSTSVDEDNLDNDSSMNMENMDPSTDQQQQVVPTNSIIDVKQNTDDDEFYETDNTKNDGLGESGSTNTHDHDLEHDYHFVPEYPEDKNECVLVRPTQPVFRRNSRNDVKIEVMESDDDASDSQFQDEMLNQSTSKGKSRIYEYYEELDEDKENVAPQNAAQNDRSAHSSGRSDTMSPMSALKPAPPSGVFLRLGLSRRSKPTKRLHNTFRRLI